jgi:ligand-binding SRPBCC domain-containing protein
MSDIKLATSIAAPIERVFDLARSIDLHMNSTSNTGERAIAGVTSGLIGPGEQVTWRARHFGIWQSLTVQITSFEPPTHFTDTMVRGAFRQMEHDHYFESSSDGTIMRDVFAYTAPLGMLGRLAELVFLDRYLRSFLVERNRVIKHAAESGEWVRYLENC